MPTKKKSGNLAGRYKKQHGLHHKHGDQYLKVYWPYIPVALVVFGGIIASLVILGTKNSSGNSSISQASLLSSTNNTRIADKLAPLQISQQLTTAAQIKANDMAMKDYWSPTSPTGQTPWQIIQTSGYNYSTAGENLAYGFSGNQTLLSAWISSPSHAANILNSNYTNVGFGVAKAPNFMNSGPQTIVVAFYADPSGSTQATSGAEHVNSTGFTSASLALPNSQSVARVETLAGGHSYTSIFIVSLVAGAAMIVIFVRHGLVVKRWATEGEKLIIKHPVIDLCLLIIILGSASLNQTVGIIR